MPAGGRESIVAAPSLHASGSVYAWLNPEATVSPLPVRWLAQLRRPERRASELPRARSETTSSSAYGRRALTGELEKLLRAPEGNRNAQLNASVFRLAQLVAGSELCERELYERAFEFALLAGLTAHESRRTIASALRAGLRYPRRAKEPR